MTKPTPEFLEMLKLATETRAAQKRFSRSRNSEDLKVSEKVADRLDEFLKKANQAERLQKDLFS